MTRNNRVKIKKNPLRRINKRNFQVSNLKNLTMTLLMRQVMILEAQIREILKSRKSLRRRSLSKMREDRL